LKLIKEGKLDDAILVLHEAVHFNPYDSVSYNNLGHAYMTKGDFTNAILALTEAVRLNPEDYSAYDVRGITYSKQGAFDKAISDFSKAINICPTNAIAIYNRAVAYAQKHSFEKAFTDFAEALKMSPNSSKVLAGRGGLYIKVGEWEKAIKDLTAAISYEPGDAEAYNSLGWLLATCPDPSVRNGSEAVKLASKACELSHWQKWYCVGTLAAAYAASNNFEQADKYQQQALTMEGATTVEMQDERKRLLLYQEHKSIMTNRRSNLDFTGSNDAKALTP